MNPRKQTYKILVPLSKTTQTLYTIYRLPLAHQYERMVIGDRGPYLEFREILLENTYVPSEQLWRFNNSTAYYLELRSRDNSNIKIYGQLRRVDYADYLPGFYYISPYDLRDENGHVLIENIYARKSH